MECRRKHKEVSGLKESIRIVLLQIRGFKKSFGLCKMSFCCVLSYPKYYRINNTINKTIRMGIDRVSSKGGVKSLGNKKWIKQRICLCNNREISKK